MEIADAVWVAENRREYFAISTDGACWGDIIAWLDNIFYGCYLCEELWRITLGFFLLSMWMVSLWLPRVKTKISIGMTTVFLYPFLGGYLFASSDKGVFMQIMLTAAIVCLLGNTIHSVIGVFSGRSLSEFLFSFISRKKVS